MPRRAPAPGAPALPFPRAAGRGLRSLLCLALCASTAHAAGHLRVETTLPGSLELEHASGWTREAALSAGAQMLWDFPAGEYLLRFRPAGERAPQERGATVGDETAGEETAGEETEYPAAATVWDDLTTLVEIDPAAGPPRASAGHGDGRGALLLLPAALTARLPGSVSRQVD
ncbi:MAG: hypothetical protein FJY75_11465, partial [Candidatus Eisenbacteria bacterium]|nr:hypothetical protein [Candidatus Eisenbacteria bacterium]